VCGNGWVKPTGGTSGAASAYPGKQSSSHNVRFINTSADI